jgi:hypothetical protein
MLKQVKGYVSLSRYLVSALTSRYRNNDKPSAEGDFYEEFQNQAMKMLSFRGRLPQQRKIGAILRFRAALIDKNDFTDFSARNNLRPHPESRFIGA